MKKERTQERLEYVQKTLLEFHPKYRRLVEAVAGRVAERVSERVDEILGDVLASVVSKSMYDAVHDALMNAEPIELGEEVHDAVATALSDEQNLDLFYDIVDTSRSLVELLGRVQVEATNVDRELSR